MNKLVKPFLLTFALLFSTPAWAEVIYNGAIKISLSEHCRTGFYIRPQTKLLKLKRTVLKFDKKNKIVVTNLSSYKFYDDIEFALIVDLIEKGNEKRQEAHRLAEIERKKEEDRRRLKLFLPHKKKQKRQIN